ncbi:hypothetical protein [Rhodopseudomonas sp.]|uniref:hypothetical protein n=1 Tax=Rhodopseudomonas sp. TaxID=1078 RepID=UPI0039E5A657
MPKDRRWWARREAMRDGSQAIATNHQLCAKRRAPAPRRDDDGRIARARQSREIATPWLFDILKAMGAVEQSGRFTFRRHRPA